ncbi:MAG: NB-ARC domain-containing protein [Crocosphaera sp.]
MEIEEVVHRLDALVYEYRNKGLEDSEKAIIRGTWDEKTYGQMEEQMAPYTTNYIERQLAPKLWRLLTQIRKEYTQKTITIRKRNFKIAIKAFLSEVDSVLPVSQAMTHSYIDWSTVPTVDSFYGRSDTLNDLEKWMIKDKCKLVALFGISGIGKTTLMAKFIENNYTAFERVIWRSLDMTPSIDDLLLDLLQSLSQVKDESLATTVDRKITKLLDFLTQHRCLLIFDQFEGVMRNDQGSVIYRENCKNYGKLLRKIREGRHKSCLLLSSQEPPREIIELASPKGRVRQLKLNGLSLEEAKELLQDYDLGGTTYAIEQLINSYKGHPLALKMSANTIKNVHNGRISPFLQGSLYMGDVLMSLLDKQFSYLSDLDKNILKYLANHSEEMTTNSIIQDFSITENISRTDITNSLNNLLHRAMIDNNQEGEESLFILEPLVKKYVKKRFNNRF